MIEHPISVEEEVVAKLRSLTTEKQREVLDFASFLVARSTEPKLKAVRGLCADLNFRISEEEIAEARKEMWGNFPRKHFFE